MVSSQTVVATCRLPWHFVVGKQQGGQGAPAVSASDAVPSQNDPGCPTRQLPATVDTPTPRPYARNGLGVPTLEPLIPSSPASFPFSEGEHQGAPYVPTPNTRAPVLRGPGTNGPARRKRGRDEADLDDEDSHDNTGKRPRFEQRNHASTGTAGSSASAPTTNHYLPHPITTAAGITPHGVYSSDGSPAASATPPALQPDSSSRSVQAQAHQSTAQPVELITTVLHAANPRRGPVSGGTEVWLEVDHIPTTFTLYAKFGDRVATTVSSTFHPFS